MQSKTSVSPLTEPIPLSAPELRGNEWRYVKECLDTNWVSSAGAFVDQFERMLADYVGSEYAVATCNGTAALHTALLVAGVQPDDEVLVSTLTFIAPANAIRYVGAWPVFMDAEPNFWQMDAQKVAEFLDKWCRWENGRLVNRATGRQVRALMPVHILGHPCDMAPLLEVARKYGLTVIEDATESLGARYEGQKVGTLGDIACFSFNGNKLLTTGGGGMIVTDNEEWAERARYLTTQAKDASYEYIHQEIGYNYRLTNIQAALGCAQLEQINDYIAAKRLIAAMYEDALGKIPGITLMKEADWAFSAFWLYTVLIDEAEYGIDCRQLLNILKEASIQTRPLWQPLHRSPAHQGAQAWRCSEADRLYEQALSLPCSVGISESELAGVVELVAINGGR